MLQLIHKLDTMNSLKALIKSTLIGAFALSISLSSVSGLAQSTPTNANTTSVATPTVASTKTPSSSPVFGVDVTACFYSFNWDTYVADVRAGKTSNPYDEKGCVTQGGVSTTSGVKYADFSNGQANTKQALGSTPVLGIFPNGSFTAQSLNTFKQDGSVDQTKQVSDRSKADGLSSVFSANQLSTIYSTGGAKTGLPRIFSTGPDSYSKNAQGQDVYQGGWCKVDGGNIVVRTERAGKTFDPNLYGRSPSTPETTCSRTVNGTRLSKVEDRNLQAYQFVYEFKFPSDTQCKDFFGVDPATCKDYFVNRYARDLAGVTNKSVTRTVSAYTYYGTFDDKYSQWVGWVNPDPNGPRRQGTDGFVRAYDGYSVYAL
jgi:hypothetical protein